MPATDAHSFDAATAMRLSGNPGVFETQVHPGWAVGDKPNGGYLQALLGRAARIRAQGEDRLGWEVASAAVT